MARNHEVTNPRDLLNADGTLAEPGWSKSLIQKYDRNAIKAPKWRIKEWDYYLILADKHAVAFTLSDDGYIGMQSASLLVFDEKNPWEQTSSILNFFPMGKYKLPRTSDAGDIKYHEAQEVIEKGIGVVDVTHYASEVLIVPVLQKKLTEAAKENGWDIEVVCSCVNGQTFWKA